MLSQACQRNFWQGLTQQSVRRIRIHPQNERKQPRVPGRLRWGFLWHASEGLRRTHRLRTLILKKRNRYAPAGGHKRGRTRC